MKAHVLRGSKEEIAQDLVRICGEVREAIVFEEETAVTPPARMQNTENIFDEMRAYMVDVADLDDSRESIYTQIEGE